MAVPDERPDTTPLYKLTIATDALLLVHVPSKTVSLNATVDPVHKLLVPFILPAPGLLNIVVVT